jgi:TRAP-type mannitol/chloroaromatic compound transport system permease large subunit
VNGAPRFLIFPDTHQIFLAVLPFIALQIIGLTLVMVFPDIVMFLPDTFG